MNLVEDYLQNNANESQRAMFEKIRAIVHEIVPEVEESISYGIPTFKHKGKYVVYWGAFKNHMSLFPAIRTGDLEKKLAKFRAAKGTLHFTEENPIPEPLLREFIKQRFDNTLTRQKKY